MTEPAPLAIHRDYVREEWIDYNRHMNVAFYVLAFDHATEAFCAHVGLGEQYLKERNKSIFVLEAHITYDREVMAGDPLRFTTRILDCDAKRVHLFHEMYHAEEGYLASTNEIVMLHVDMADRRSAPMPPEILERVTQLKDAHSALPRPAQVGRVIGLKKRAAA
jgi:acyl-CoA thioester hydrolase